MKINQKIKVLKKIARELNQAHVTWAVGASMLLYFKGLTVDVHDLDLMIIEQDVDVAKKILLNMGILHPTVIQSKYKTKVFLEFMIDEVEVDVMAGFSIEVNDKIINCSLEKDENIEFINLDGIEIPLQSVKQWFKYYEYMGRMDKVNAIQKYLLSIEE
jgi:hypothetical protein